MGGNNIFSKIKGAEDQLVNHLSLILPNREDTIVSLKRCFRN